MPGEIVFLSRLPWDSERPETLIISCVDGRWRPYIQEFIQEHLKTSPHTDFMAVPGGVEPLTLVDLIPKDFNFFRRRIESLVSAHGTRRIVAIAHQDCAWYLERKIGPFRLDPREHQLRDLRRAAAWLREVFPGVRVETYFAKRVPGGGDAAGHGTAAGAPAVERVAFEIV